ncbi:MAG: phytoene/squalene synthase family protein [Balneolales bacterium]
MKPIFDNLSVQISKKVTRAYSTSFSLGIYFLHHRLRDHIYAIYGFVRLADEIVDSFHGYDRSYLLSNFKKETYEALERGISVNPVLHAFQQTVHRFAISEELIVAFFQSMEMDLEQVDYTFDKYQKYIFGSAEVVGLMCLTVFTEGDQQRYEELNPYARKLGAAFQKVNFLRDLREDYHMLGRIYFPKVDLTNFTEQSKKQIEDEIEEDFNMALKGIRELPASSKGGVYLAYVTYRSLFVKIKKLPATRIMNERVCINNGIKFGLMFKCHLQNKLNRI